MYKMKSIQSHLHSVRRRAWKHKIAMHHMKKSISEMEKVYLNTGLKYNNIVLYIYEMKMYKIQEYFEYKNALMILKNHVLFTA